MSNWANGQYGSSRSTYQAAGHNPQSRSRDMGRYAQASVGQQNSYPSQAMAAAQLAMNSGSTNGLISPRSEDYSYDSTAHSRQASRGHYAQPPPLTTPNRPVKTEADEPQRTHPSLLSPAGSTNSPLPQPSGSLSSTPYNQPHLYQSLTTVEHFINNPSNLNLNAALSQPSASPRILSSSESINYGPVPQFRRLRTVQDLHPVVNVQPPFRRANPEGGFISPLQALTSHLPSTYRICNPGFKYESSRNPRRVLTKPSKGTKNDGYDNEDSDYILYVNDILGSEDAGTKNRYLILDVLGQGTFGQVVKCQNLKTQEVVAVKVVKNRTAYFNQSMMEVSVLDLLNSKLDKNDDHNLLRLKDTFIHKQHLCLVFELLSVNLYELIKQNQFRGLSTTLVRVFAQQLLHGLGLLSKARLIHCDLKPENILLKNLESPVIKIIDFGSACDERQTVYTYIQSRFYRSPEVLLGLPYSSSIDMWSLGCIVVELFLGLPLFPGSSEYNQVQRITEMLNLPPTWMLETGKQAADFFDKAHDEYGMRIYRLKSMEQYAREHNTSEQPSKKYFTATRLEDIIRQYPLPRKNMKPQEVDREYAHREAFIDFVKGLLNINPLERWSPQQARLHPFITQHKYTGAFKPPADLKISNINKSTAPGVQSQQAAEQASRQRAEVARAQQAQAQAQAQAQVQAQVQAAHVHAQTQAAIAAQSAFGAMQHQMGNYTAQAIPSAVYGQPFSPSQALPPPYTTPPQSAYPNQYSGQPPSYPAQPQYGQHLAHMGAQQPQQQALQQPSMHQQAAVRAARQRANTMEQQQAGIPTAMQRVASHLDPNAPIRLQPSPAYYPPPQDGGESGGIPGSARRPGRGSRLRGNSNFIRNLEERTMEEGYAGSNQHY